jgi:hypothetical protein
MIFEVHRATPRLACLNAGQHAHDTRTCDKGNARRRKDKKAVK